MGVVPRGLFERGSETDLFGGLDGGILRCLGGVVVVLMVRGSGGAWLYTFRQINT